MLGCNISYIMSVLIDLVVAYQIQFDKIKINNMGFLVVVSHMELPFRKIRSWTDKRPHL